MGLVFKMSYSLFNTYDCVLLKNIKDFKKGKRMRVVRMPKGFKEQTWYLVDSPLLPSILLDAKEGEDFEIVKDEPEVDKKRKK